MCVFAGKEVGTCIEKKMIYFVCSDLCYQLLICQSCLLLIRKTGTLFYAVLCSAFIIVHLLPVLQKCRFYLSIHAMCKAKSSFVKNL